MGAEDGADCDFFAEDGPLEEVLGTAVGARRGPMMIGIAELMVLVALRFAYE